ncbi:MAG: hypothetical protein AAF620_11840 [Bacteroidota bacterium]
MTDTLSISKQLQQSGLDPAQADAIAGQMGHIIDSDLVSKQNLKELEISFSHELEKSRSQTIENKLLLQKEIEETKLVLRREIEETKLVLQKEMKEIESSLQKEMKEIEIRLTEKSNAQLKWIFGFLVGQAGLIAALVKLIG